MKHVLSYEGKCKVSLGLMQEAYMPLFLPWANWRMDVEGTLLRPPYSLTSGIEWVRGLDKDKGKNEVFAILLQGARKGTYSYIGHTGIHGVQWPHGFASTGSVIGARATQGQGYGTEAKLLLLYHAFMVLGLRKLTSTVKAFNTQSAGHLMKCGYKPIGRYHRHHLHNGAFVDEIMLEVFRENWQPVWDAYQSAGTLPTLTNEQRSFLKSMDA